MKIEQTKISGLFLITPNVFLDKRGLFFETFNRDIFSNHGITINIVQENQSISGKHVLRGLHFQKPPYAQGKLVRVISGAAQDVAVDLRKHSPTYGKWESALLTETNKQMFWIPEGFAHGFLALEENTIFSYLCTAPYHKESEDCLFWNDADLNINWENADNPIVSDKDQAAKDFKSFVSPF